ncbi:uridine diphosphate-N-acetylglucosamine-binding protein YvcK [Phascolarctobacterium sp.]|uniref:gluconeogenesis factor YvcK family protein n=1 Tax=Phascolarctobacterium sp. TaxID=2049039 RepID=UPI00386E4DC4
MGWISWLCPGINLKRWLLLFAVGVLLCALGLALFFNYQLMGKAEELLFQMTYWTTGRYSNGLIMGMGVVFLIVGFGVMIYGTRRLVSSVVSVVVPDKNGSLMETIFMQRKLTNGPAITVVGGGTGLSTLLRGMKYITSNCTAVVTSADDGGSSGRLRKELGIIPPGDLRNCLTALADREPLMERLMQYRFQGYSPLAGHCFGNLFIAAMAQAEGDMEAGLNATSQILKVRGRVIPSTLANIQLRARMYDGTTVTGESEIPKAKKRIAKMMMVPADAPAAKGAMEAIINADVLIFGPGSLYTSVIPNLLVDGIRDAIIQSKAVKIYICNVMTQPGETDGYGAYEHVKALVDHMGCQFLDYVIVNSQAVTQEQLRQYHAEGSTPITPDIDKIRSLGITVVPARLISKKDLVRHDPRKLARVLIALIYRLRLFGRGMQFFDYFFMRQGMRKMNRQDEEK